MYVGQGVPIIHDDVVETLEVAVGFPATTWFRENVK